MMTRSNQEERKQGEVFAHCWVCGKPIHKGDTGYYKMFLKDDYCCFEHSMIGMDCDEDKER